jgi:thioredoxin-like negative regulator of GroEL
MEKLQRAARGEAVCLSRGEIVQLAALAENALNAGRLETADRLLPGLRASLTSQDDPELTQRIEHLAHRSQAGDGSHPPA